MAARKKTPTKKAPTKKTPTKKASAKKTATKKASSRSARSTPASATRRSPALDTSRDWSLDELERFLPVVSDAHVAALRAAILRAQSNDALAALGSSFRTDDILAAAPGFVAGSLLAIEKLGGPPPGLALELLPLFVYETRELTRVNLAFEQQARDVASEIAGRRDELKVATSRALRARRGVARTLLRSVLPQGAKQRAELERAAAKAPTPASVIASARTVARILAEVREDPALASVLDRYRYDDAFVARLRSLAADVERLADAGARLTPPQNIDQRALDRQDGLVLALIRAIYIPLREARDDGAAVTLPPLGPLERLVITISPSGSDDEDTEPTPEPVAS